MLYMMKFAAVTLAVAVASFCGVAAQPATKCVESGGQVSTSLCCKGTGDFPNTCIPGACGCSPEDSEEVKVCFCAARDYCFDGSQCVYLIDPEGEASCVESGGKVSIELICRGFEHFPNTCVPGPYSCSSSDKWAIPTCICPGPNPCYDGTKCSSLEPDPTEEYFTLDIIGGGCIGLDQGSARQGNRLKLLECVSDNDAIQWSIDEDIRFHSKVDADMCMQAGHGNSVNDGTKMRIYPCSSSEFQKFDDSFVSDGPFGPIKLESEPGLCVVPRGVNRDIGIDPIILKECDGLEEDRAIGWEGDNPCMHPPWCEP